jgi:hypothetical protein
VYGPTTHRNAQQGGPLVGGGRMAAEPTGCLEVRCHPEHSSTEADFSRKGCDNADIRLGRHGMCAKTAVRLSVRLGCGRQPGPAVQAGLPACFKNGYETRVGLSGLNGDHIRLAPQKWARDTIQCSYGIKPVSRCWSLLIEICF